METVLLSKVLPILVGTSEQLSKGVNDIKFGCNSDDGCK